MLGEKNYFFTDFFLEVFFLCVCLIVLNIFSFVYTFVGYLSIYDSRKCFNSQFNSMHLSLNTTSWVLNKMTISGEFFKIALTF